MKKDFKVLIIGLGDIGMGFCNAINSYNFPFSTKSKNYIYEGRRINEEKNAYIKAFAFDNRLVYNKERIELEKKPWYFSKKYCVRVYTSKHPDEEFGKARFFGYSADENKVDGKKISDVLSIDDFKLEKEKMFGDSIENDYAISAFDYIIICVSEKTENFKLISKLFSYGSLTKQDVYIRCSDEETKELFFRYYENIKQNNIIKLEKSINDSKNISSKKTLIEKYEYKKYSWENDKRQIIPFNPEGDVAYTESIKLTFDSIVDFSRIADYEKNKGNSKFNDREISDNNKLLNTVIKNDIKNGQGIEGDFVNKLIEQSKNFAFDNLHKKTHFNMYKHIGLGKIEIIIKKIPTEKNDPNEILFNYLKQNLINNDLFKNSSESSNNREKEYKRDKYKLFTVGYTFVNLDDSSKNIKNNENSIHHTTKVFDDIADKFIETKEFSCFYILRDHRRLTKVTSYYSKVVCLFNDDSELIIDKNVKKVFNKFQKTLKKHNENVKWIDNMLYQATPQSFDCNFAFSDNRTLINVTRYYSKVVCKLADGDEYIIDKNANEVFNRFRNSVKYNNKKWINDIISKALPEKRDNVVETTVDSNTIPDAKHGYKLTIFVRGTLAEQRKINDKIYKIRNNNQKNKHDLFVIGLSTFGKAVALGLNYLNKSSRVTVLDKEKDRIREICDKGVTYAYCEDATSLSVLNEIGIKGSKNARAILCFGDDYKSALTTALNLYSLNITDITIRGDGSRTREIKDVISGLTNENIYDRKGINVLSLADRECCKILPNIINNRIIEYFPFTSEPQFRLESDGLAKICSYQAIFDKVFEETNKEIREATNGKFKLRKLFGNTNESFPCHWVYGKLEYLLLLANNIKDKEEALKQYFMELKEASNSNVQTNKGKKKIKQPKPKKEKVKVDKVKKPKKEKIKKESKPKKDSLLNK